MRNAYYSLMKINSGNMCPESIGSRNNRIGLAFVGRLIYRSVFGPLVALLFFSEAEAAPEKVADRCLA